MIGLLLGPILATILLIGPIGLERNVAVAFGQTEFVEVRVRPGDTVWELVAEHYQGERPIRAVIEDVRNYNNLQDLNLYPGQVICLPV